MTSPDVLWIRELPKLEAPWRGLGDVVTMDRSLNAHLGGLPDYLMFTISPGIGDHSLEAHSIHALGAVILFQVAGVMAEKLGLRAVQQDLMGLCNGGEVRKALVLADYTQQPAFPFRYENMCQGFQAALIHGVGDATLGQFDGEAR